MRKDNAPQNLSLLKKIVLNLIRLDTADKTKASLRLKRKGAAWNDASGQGFWASHLHDIRVRRPWVSLYAAKLIPSNMFVVCGSVGVLSR